MDWKSENELPTDGLVIPTPETDDEEREAEDSSKSIDEENGSFVD